MCGVVCVCVCIHMYMYVHVCVSVYYKYLSQIPSYRDGSSSERK